MIQDTIRRECREQTVLIIAHRLGTVADCDLIIELDAGKIASKREPKKSVRRNSKEGSSSDLVSTAKSRKGLQMLVSIPYPVGE